MPTRIDLRLSRVISMRELNQQTSAVIDEINKSGQPAVLTKHGRFVALITPLEERIESIVLVDDDDAKTVLEETREQERDESTHGVTLDQARLWAKND
jgi:prevent-host-death family protein